MVVSHNHYDHLDLPSIEAIGNQALWLVPLRNRQLLESVGVTNVVGLDWWESHTVGDWTFTATPVQHWSASGLYDRLDVLWLRRRERSGACCLKRGSRRAMRVLSQTRRRVDFGLRALLAV